MQRRKGREGREKKRRKNQTRRLEEKDKSGGSEFEI